MDAIKEPDNDVTHAAVASIAAVDQSSINTSVSAPDLSDDKLVALQLKDTIKNNSFAPCLKLPKGKVNKNNFEAGMYEIK